MNKKLLSSSYRHLTKMWMLIAILMVSSFSASAQIEWKDLELNTHLDEATAEYKFTPSKSGILTLWSQDRVIGVYTALTPDGNDVDYSTGIHANTYASFTDNGVTFAKKSTANVTAGETYYILSSIGFSKNKVFMAVMDTEVSELKLLSVSQPVGEMYNITDSRDGQVELEFNLPATADDNAILTVGTHTAEIETRQDVNSGKIIFALKPTLTEWMEAGYFEAGEPMSLKITGLKAKANENLIYGTDGTLVLEWTTPAKPHYHLSTTGITEFLSYWIPGDERGIAVLEFDYDLMTKENGQTATALIQIGSADLGDAYEEKIESDKITVDGKKLYVDFTGKLRSYEAMGLTMKWGSITIKVGNILMADGTCSFNETQGNYGSVTFGLTFTEYRSDIQAEFTPADGATLTDNFFKVYFSDKNALTFGGVRVSYQTQDDVKYQTDITEGITSEAIGNNGIEYTIPLTDEIVAGKNIRISFIDQVSADGYNHDFNVKYNPGPELINDLKPVAVSVKEGEILSACENITLTFDSDVVINTVDTPEMLVMFSDVTNGKTIPATIEVSADDAKQVVITPTQALTDAHKYNVYVNYFVVVNQEYIDQAAKYGRYMPGYEVNFTLSSLYKEYDFATDPIVGSTVSELSRISCTTKEGADAYTQAISPTRNPEALTWVENEDGTKVTDCTINDDIQDGFIIVLNEPITTSGKYTVVLQPGVYQTGEGYGIQPQEDEVRLSYTVLSAPQEVITITATDPVSESKVESLNQIMVEFSEPVYGDDATVYVSNKTTYATYNATLTINPKLRTVGMIQLDEEVTEEGSYTIYIPNAVVGDETWYNNDAQTGNCNTYAVLYYTIGGTSGGDEDFFTVDPANGSTVESLSHIKITFNEEGGIGSGMITVKKDGEQIARIDAKYDDFNNVYDFHINFNATEEGVYTFEVPEGYFTLSGNPAPAFTLTYTIGGGSETSEWTTDPANGSTVTSLYEIHVWNNTVEFLSGGPGKATLYRDGVELEKIADPEYGNDNNELKLHTAVEYTEPGVYTLEVPEGFFADENGDPLSAVTFTWTISGGSEASEWATDPADGSTVTSLKRIRFTSLKYKSIMPGSGSVVFKKDGVVLEEVSRSDYEEDYGYNEWYVETSQEYTEPGVYTVELPDGFFTSDGQPVAGTTITLTIAASGIDSIFTDDNATTNVYSIDGRLIKSNANKSDFMNLEQGIYIIGNQKVQLRK
ncbi:MAG: Ig-like domain-containing protein [Muribaculaceae bacterium]